VGTKFSALPEVLTPLSTDMVAVVDGGASKKAQIGNLPIASAQLTGVIPNARLTGVITDAEVAAGAAITWTKISKTGSSLADLTTRSAAALNSGILPVARLGNGVTTPATTTATGAQADFAPGLAGDTLVRCNNATDLTISGLAGGVDGQRVTFISIGAGNVFFKHQDTGSIAANRFTNMTTSGDSPLAAGFGSVTYIYDATSTAWRMLAHDQGARLTWTPTYTASASMTFTTVTTTAARYYLRGRILIVTFDFTGTVGGTPDVKLFATLPNGYTVPTGAFSVYDAITGGVMAIMQSRSGLTTLEFYSSPTGAANWAAGSQHLVGTIETELT
jgi:hypothetical protein